jgi:ketosteroid isomerase-like protein
MRAAHPTTESGSSPLPQAAPTRLAETTDRDAVERATETFNAHDLDGLADLLADDVVCCAPGGVQEQGKAACVALHRRWLADFPDARVEVRTRHRIGDVVVEEGTFRGRHDGVAHTGRCVCLDFVRVLRVRDGKHVSLKVMFDRLLMLEQLGLV